MWTEVPDPQDPATFERSKLNWQLAGSEGEMLKWYKRLTELRKRFVVPGERRCAVEVRDGAIVMRVPASDPKLMVAANLKGPELPDVGAGWERILAAADDSGAVEVHEYRKSVVPAGLSS
jgi:maltooligosyltrehalose trehalohydrolase